MAPVTGAGTCVPPGESKNARPDASAGKSARRRGTSRSTRGTYQPAGAVPPAQSDGRRGQRAVSVARDSRTTVTRI